MENRVFSFLNFIVVPATVASSRRAGFYFINTLSSDKTNSSMVVYLRRNGEWPIKMLLRCHVDVTPCTHDTGVLIKKLDFYTESEMSCRKTLPAVTTAQKRVWQLLSVSVPRNSNSRPDKGLLLVWSPKMGSSIIVRTQTECLCM